MKRFAALAACWGLTAAPLAAGTIVGTVEGHGPAPVAIGGSDGSNNGGPRYKFAERVDYARLQDFVVYIDQVVPGAPAPLQPRQMAQHAVAFDPHVLVVAVGTKVEWPNRDDIYHDVFSMSETDEFDLGLRSNREPAQTHVFSKVGRIDVFCSIHSKMHGIVLVLPSPYFAKVNARHHYRIEDIPGGSYKVRAWHERLPHEDRMVVVPETGEVTVNFDLGLSSLPKR